MSEPEDKKTTKAKHDRRIVLTCAEVLLNMCLGMNVSVVYNWMIKTLNEDYKLA